MLVDNAVAFFAAGLYLNPAFSTRYGSKFSLVGQQQVGYMRY